MTSPHDNFIGGMPSADVSGIVTGAIMRYVKSSAGEIGHQTMVRELGIGPTQARVLEDPTCWVSAQEADELFQTAKHVTGDPEVGRKIGAHHLKLHDQTGIADLMVGLKKTHDVISNLSSISPKYTMICDIMPLEVGDAHAVIRVRSRDGYKRSLQFCLFTQGMLTQIPVLFGLVPAVVTETECEARGGRFCLYSVAWQEQQWSSFIDEGTSLFAMAWEEDTVAETDSHLFLDTATEIEQLKGQVNSLSSRLEEVYTTASELLESDDLDAILRSITRRAAHGVNAPKFLLAVRTSDEEELRVDQTGFTPAEANLVTRDLIEGHLDDKDGSKLIVEIASARQHYGWLVAMLQERMRFLENDRQTLTLYAGYAATALDVATSLMIARRRDATARSLLAFGTAVSTTKSRQEVAKMLADTVPDVLGAVGAVVLLYDAEKDELVETARNVPPTEEVNVPIETVRIPPEGIPGIENIMKGGEALVFTLNDPQQRVLLEPWKVTSGLVAPLVSGEKFIGTVHAGFVTEKTTDIKIDSDLRERFSGLCNLAVTAFENARLMEQISHMAWHDALTGLPNRRVFEDRVRQELTRIQRTGESLTVFYVDLDRFKQVNDTMGHAAGDDLICQVANRLSESVRNQDTVARLGGDEFAVLLPGLQDMQVIERLAKRMLVNLQTPFTILGQEVNSSGSIGVACTGGRLDITFDELVHEADMAMYKSKTLGRNTYEVYSEDSAEAPKQQAALAEDLLNAKDNGELEILYQAQIDLSNMSIVGVEALLRWNHPRLGRLLPAAFLSAAENYHVLPQIDQWVIETACRQGSVWDSLGLSPIKIGINLTVSDLASESFSTSVLEIIRTTGFNPERLEFEISQNIANLQGTPAYKTYEELKALGVKIAVDDAGSRQEMLDTLKDFAIDTFKIDRALVQGFASETADNNDSQSRSNDIDEARHEAALIAITELAKSMGAQLIGEGVETSEQRDKLVAAGCTVLQGYFFSPPVRARDIVVMIQASAHETSVIG